MQSDQSMQYQLSCTLRGKQVQKGIKHGCLGFLQKPTVQACILPKSSINPAWWWWVVDTGLVSQNTCLHSGLLQKPQAPMQKWLFKFTPFDDDEVFVC